MAACHICTLAKGKAFLSMGTVGLYRSHTHHVSPDLMACFFLDPKLTSCRSQLHTYPLIHSTNAFCCPRSMVHWDTQMKRGCSRVTYFCLLQEPPVAHPHLFLGPLAASPSMRHIWAFYYIITANLSLSLSSSIGS